MMATSSFDRSPLQGHGHDRETSDNIDTSTGTPGGFLYSTAGESVMVRTMLRAKAQEFKPRPPTLRATASEFEPSRDLVVVAQAFEDFAPVALSLLNLSLLHQNSPYGIGLSINQSKFSPNIINGRLSLSKAVPATEFHVFPKLPAELRFTIWKLCLPGPRIIALHYNALASRAVSSTPTPAALHTSRESRQEALELYILLFEESVLNATVYINAEIDSLYLSEDLTGSFVFVPESTSEVYANYFKTMLKTLHPSIWNSVKNLAVSNTTYEKAYKSDSFPIDCFVMTKFPNLLTISMVLARPSTSYETNHRLVDVPWRGCTHVKECKPGSRYANSETSETYHPCEVCQQICHQVRRLEVEDGPHWFSPEELLYNIAGDLKAISKWAEGWKMAQPKVKYIVTNSEADWEHFSQAPFPQFDVSRLEDILQA